MKDTGHSTMVSLFLASYEDFKVRLRKRLGSEDLANDVLHETYLRVDRMDMPPNLAQPNAYLYRMALNIAADRRQADARLLTGSEVEELLQTVDEAQDAFPRVLGFVFEGLLAAVEEGVRREFVGVDLVFHR